MSIVSQEVKNLVAGISQQPNVLRHAEQLESQVNCLSTETGGLQKRPPTVFISKLNDTPSNSLTHLVDRDTDEKYIMILTGSGAEIYDLEGNLYPITYEGSSLAYLTTDTPRDDLKALTVADYTFVINKDVETEMSSDYSYDYWDSQGVLVNIKSGQYGRTYSITINDVEVASYKTPDGSSSSDVTSITTDYIVGKLATQATAKGYRVTTGSSWLNISTADTTADTVYTTLKTQIESTLSSYDTIITRPTTTTLSLVAYNINTTYTDHWQNALDSWEALGYTIVSSNITTKTKDQNANSSAQVFSSSVATATFELATITNTILTLSCKDGFNNEAIIGVLENVQTFSDLPSSAPDRFTVYVYGEAASSSDDYYVYYDEADALWKETYKPGLQNDFNQETMPIAIVRNADGTFTAQNLTWSGRESGDLDSNPLPSFIGAAFNDIFFFRNRLGFTSGENVVLSRSASFFDYWFASATEVQDTDPIDLPVSDNKVVSLHHTISFSNDLILFSNNAQFALRAEGTLTPSSAYVDTLTYYDNSNVAPVGAGRYVYFVTPRSKYSSIKEYFTALDNTEDKEAQEVTAHVPNYIPNGITKMVSNTSEDIIAVLTEGDPTKVYVYKYLFIDSVKRQSSWSHWELDGDIVGMDYINSTLYIIIQRGDNTFLETMELTYNTTDFDEEPFRVHLDSKKYCLAADCSTYDSTEDKTTISILTAYGITALDSTELTYALIEASTGRYVEIPTGDESVTIYGTFGDFFIGRKFTSSIELSRLMIKKTDQSGGTSSVVEGKLQLQRLWLSYVDTGHLQVDVVAKNRAYKYAITGTKLDTEDSYLGEASLETGIFKVPLHCKPEDMNVTISSDMPVPFALVGMGWVGNYNKRSRSI